MRLPRLGNPTVHRTIERSFLGDEVVTEITVAPTFDIMPTWAQWFIAAVSCFTFIGGAVILAYEYFK